MVPPPISDIGGGTFFYLSKAEKIELMQLGYDEVGNRER
jgi:hypothetical protein